MGEKDRGAGGQADGNCCKYCYDKDYWAGKQYEGDVGNSLSEVASFAHKVIVAGRVRRFKGKKRGTEAQRLLVQADAAEGRTGEVKLRIQGVVAHR